MFKEACDSLVVVAGIACTAHIHSAMIKTADGLEGMPLLAFLAAMFALSIPRQLAVKSDPEVSQPTINEKSAN